MRAGSRSGGLGLGGADGFVGLDVVNLALDELGAAGDQGCGGLVGALDGDLVVDAMGDADGDAFGEIVGDEAARLQTLWHEHFPLSKAMDVRVVSFADHVLTTHTGLAGNTNVHDTAFAGSLYAIESLTAWGVLYLELMQAGFDASIIHARGNIEFDAPVRDDIIATSSFAGQQHIFDELRRTGKCRLTLTTHCTGASSAAGDPPASRFEGLYVVRLNTTDASAKVS